MLGMAKTKLSAEPFSQKGKCRKLTHHRQGDDSGESLGSLGDGHHCSHKQSKRLSHQDEQQHRKEGGKKGARRVMETPHEVEDSHEQEGQGAINRQICKQFACQSPSEESDQTDMQHVRVKFAGFIISKGCYVSDIAQHT